MSIRLLCPGLVLGLAAFLAPQAAEAAHHPPPPPSTVYVSPSGSDLNPGTVSRPIKTLTHARDIVRRRLSHARGDLTVYLENGTYRLGQPLLLSPSDSGRHGHEVFWRAAPGATPIVTGAMQIAGWTRVNAALNIWSASVPATLQTRQLYVDGARASIASGPVPTQLACYPSPKKCSDSTGYSMASPVMATWRNPSDIEFVYSQQLGQMTEPICPIASISQTVITMAQPCWNNSTRRQINSVTKWYDDNLVGWNALSLPSYVENAYEVLTKPGQFYLDSTSHRLYYIPRVGQSMRSADVEAPFLETLVQGAGTTNNPIRNISFSGIQFTGATWMQPSTNQGFSEVQSGYTLTGSGAWSRQGLCHLVGSGSCPYGAWTKEPAAVRLADDRNITFQNDRFFHLGAAGLDLGDGSQDDVVSSSVFTDISGNGIEIGGVHLPNAGPNQQTKDVQVIDNHVYDIGVEYPGAAGILMGYAAGCSITHNQIDDLPYTGISAGWAGWLGKVGRPSLPNYSHDNVIAYNLIFNYMQTVSDGGGIYTQGVTGPSLAHGEKVIGNVIHDQIDWSFALHSDDGAGYITYSGNVLYSDTYEWCCNHRNFSRRSGNYPQYFAGNYWQTGDYPSRAGGVIVKDNHLISGPDDVPDSVVARAGIEPADESILNWQPGNDPVPVSPTLVGAVYAIDDQAYVTWHAAISGSTDPVTSYTVTACAASGGIVSPPCADPGPSVTISGSQYLMDGYAVVTGLTPGVSYWFSVVASNGQGLSTPSEPSPVVTAGSHLSTLSGPPRSVMYRISGGRISLKWRAPASADCTGSFWAGKCANPVLAYQITVSNGATYVVSSLEQLIVSNGGGTAMTVLDGLQPDRSYRFSIAAVTPAGTGTQATTRWVFVSASWVSH